MGMVLQDSEGIIQQCNAEAGQILGLTSEQLIGCTSFDPPWQTIHEDGSIFLGENHPAMVALSTGAPCSDVVMGLYKPNGELIWLKVSSQPLFTGDTITPISVLTTFLECQPDIDGSAFNDRHNLNIQQQVAELAAVYDTAPVGLCLLDNELIYRHLADTMPQIFWITQPDGYHEYYNQRWYDYTGTKPGDSHGEGWQNPLHPDDVERTVVVWQESLRTGTPYDIEYRFRRASDGEYRWHIGRAMPLRDKDGRILKWFGSCTDIHDQKLALEERDQSLERERAARNELEKANRIKDEFLAVVSHELRSPLNPILGWARLLRTKSFDPQSRDRALETIERNAKLQSQLIDDLLDVSRILRGKLNVTLAPVNLATVIEASITTVQIAAEAKSIQIYKNFDAQVGKVTGDFNRLQQVVWNLLTNAVKFAPEGGRVKVYLTQSQQSAQVQICDNGKGIRAEALPYIFERFRQADNGTTRQFGGLGLGLAIVQHIVEVHKGTIKADSAGENQGATFTVQIPLIPEPVTVPEVQSMTVVSLQDDEQLLTGLNLLVVDDEDDARELNQFLLEQDGATVKVAGSAMEALSIVTQLMPDVIISDLGMPLVDGYEFIQRVRQLPVEQGGKIPAIAVTAYAREEDRIAALKAGFQAHLTKPVEATQLLKTVLQLSKR